MTMTKKIFAREVKQKTADPPKINLRFCSASVLVQEVVAVDDNYLLVAVYHRREARETHNTHGFKGSRQIL